VVRRGSGRDASGRCVWCGTDHPFENQACVGCRLSSRIVDAGVDKRLVILLEVRLTPLLYNRRGPVRQRWRLRGLWIIACTTTLALIAHLAYSQLLAAIIESKPEAMDSIGREVRYAIVLSIRSRHSLAGNHCL
jgi:hypothetical protein